MPLTSVRFGKEKRAETASPALHCTHIKEMFINSFIYIFILASLASASVLLRQPFKKLFCDALAATMRS